MGAAVGRDERPSLRWFPDSQLEPAACPLCGELGSEVVVATPDPRSGEVIDFIRCARCGSVWPSAVEHLEYPADDVLWDDPEYRIVLHHALELVSGLGHQVAFVESIGRRPGGRVLEIGCNVGILSAYLRSVWDADVWCIEPSVFGRMANAAFGLDPRRCFFDESLDSAWNGFDAIVAVEVIEHVDDPRAFLTEIAARLAPGGAVVVTTPAAESLDGTLDAGIALGVLSVGAHNFLYSRDQLEADAKAAGLIDVDVERNGHQLVLRAGVADGVPPDATSPTAIDALVRDFYAGRVAPTDPLPRAELGLAIADYIARRTHDPSSAVDLEREIEQMLVDVMGIDVHHLAPTVDAVLATTRTGEFGARIPFRLGEFVYWRAHRDDLDEFARTSMLEASLLIIDHGLRADLQNLLPLLPSLGPPVLALEGRPPGEFGVAVERAVAESPNEVLQRYRPASRAERWRRSARSRIGSIRRRLPI